MVFFIISMYLRLLPKSFLWFKFEQNYLSTVLKCMVFIKLSAHRAQTRRYASVKASICTSTLCKLKIINYKETGIIYKETQHLSKGAVVL